MARGRLDGGSGTRDGQLGTGDAQTWNWLQLGTGD
jgi:hypothetical protein